MLEEHFRSVRLHHRRHPEATYRANESQFTSLLACRRKESSLECDWRGCDSELMRGNDMTTIRVKNYPNSNRRKAGMKFRAYR